jgi:hypothetical protein
VLKVEQRYMAVYARANAARVLFVREDGNLYERPNSFMKEYTRNEVTLRRRPTLMTQTA